VNGDELDVLKQGKFANLCGEALQHCQRSSDGIARWQGCSDL
jgi:hypothetical protein